MENWKPVTGFVGLYEVSDLGRVRSLDRDPIKNPIHRRFWQGKILRPGISKGYAVVQLCGVRTKKSQQGLVHRLVAKEFVPNPSGYPMVNHKNCNRSDNRSDNLEWCTHEMNMRHAKENGRMTCKHRTEWNRILSDDDVKKIRELARSGVRNVEIAQRFKINRHYVSGIIHGHERGKISERVPMRWTRKLSDADVMEIFRLHANGFKQSSIAAKFNVDPSHISRMVRGLARFHSEND